MTKVKWPRKIGVVDDDAAVRDGLVAVLEIEGRDAVPFASGEAFLAGVDGAGLDAAILDLRMGEVGGLEVLRRLSPLPFPIVMISAHADVQAAVQAIKLGAADFVEKPFTPDEIEAALAHLTPNRLETGRDPLETILEPLTPRERDVAMALNEGLTNKEIARDLGCSPRTVEVHRSRVFEKLEVRNVAGLVRRMTLGERASA